LVSITARALPSAWKYDTKRTCFEWSSIPALASLEMSQPEDCELNSRRAKSSDNAVLSNVGGGEGYVFSSLVILFKSFL